MECTDQMNPVKDVNSFVKAMVECSSDPAPRGYKPEGKPELRPILRRMIAEYASGVIQA